MPYSGLYVHSFGVFGPKNIPIKAKSLREHFFLRHIIGFGSDTLFYLYKQFRLKRKNRVPVIGVKFL